jgi:hypothetical protein
LGFSLSHKRQPAPLKLLAAVIFVCCDELRFLFFENGGPLDEHIANGPDAMTT